MNVEHDTGDFDVLVIGAGPAGAACAIHAASCGLYVGLVGQSRSRQRPGETLHPGIEPLFDQLGIGNEVRQAGWLRHTGHFVVDGVERFVAYGEDCSGPWRGFQAPTVELDEMLRRRARALGATNLEGWATKLLLESPPRGDESSARVVGVRVGTNAVRGRFLVDATGHARLVARTFGLSRRRLGPSRCVLWGYAEGAPVELERGPRFEVRRDGWLWRAQVSKARYAWVWSPTDGDRKCNEARLTALVGGRLVGRWRGADATSSRVECPAFENVLLTGDAAFSVSPLSAKGVLRAIMSGIMAAETAQSALRAGRTDLATGQVDGYCDWVADWFGAEADAVEAAHASFETRGVEVGLQVSPRVPLGPSPSDSLSARIL